MEFFPQIAMFVLISISIQRIFTRKLLNFKSNQKISRKIAYLDIFQNIRTLWSIQLMWRYNNIDIIVNSTCRIVRKCLNFVQNEQQNEDTLHFCCHFLCCFDGFPTVFKCPLVPFAVRSSYGHLKVATLRKWVKSENIDRCANGFQWFF